MPKDYKFSPELNVWAKRIVDSSVVSKSYSNISVPLDETLWLKSFTFIDLLFNYTFKSPDFTIFYKIIDFFDSNDKNIKNRLIVVRGKTAMYVADEYTPRSNTITTNDPYSEALVPNPINSMSVNVFDITYGELYMLKLLREHKNGNAINLSNIIYNNLGSSFSKLIYLYLNVEINNDYSLYNDMSLVNSNDRLIVNLYEKFIIEHYYRRVKYSFASTLNKDYLLPTKSKGQMIRLKLEDINTKYWNFPIDVQIIDSQSIFLVHNSKQLVYGNDYEILMDSSTTPNQYRLSWSGKGLESLLNPIKNVLYLIWTYRQQ